MQAYFALVKQQYLPSQNHLVAQKSPSPYLLNNVLRDTRKKQIPSSYEFSLLFFCPRFRFFLFQTAFGRYEDGAAADVAAVSSRTHLSKEL